LEATVGLGHYHTGCTAASWKFVEKYNNGQRSGAEGAGQSLHHMCWAAEPYRSSGRGALGHARGTTVV
ncbi:hypothetical protein AcW1_009057, partial [Taiwanofungus camphoratus]